MSEEKVVSEKSIRRRRAISMFFYEIGRYIHMVNPFAKLRGKRKQKLRKRQLIFVWGMRAIPIIHFLIFWVYVNADAITMAFRNIDYAAGGIEYWTFDNFKEVWKMFSQGNAGADLLAYGKNTLRYWLVSTVWSMPHSILLTYAFHKKLRGRKVFRVFLYLPTIICSVALTGIFRSFISQKGIFGAFLIDVCGWERVPNWFQEIEYANGALLFYAIFFSMAGSYVLYSGAMANVSTEVTEAAYMDGVSMWQEIWYIDIPLMWPTLSMQVITTFSTLFSASGPILLFTPYIEETYTWGYWIFDQVRRFQSYYLPATLGLCFTIIAFPIAMLVKHKVENMYTTE